MTPARGILGALADPLLNICRRVEEFEATAFSADSTVPVVLKRVWSVRAVADNEKELNRLFVRFVLSIDRLISAFSGNFLPYTWLSVGPLKT